MNSVLFAVSAAWSIRILANLVSYVHLWYVKEYRFDRMVIHLRTPQGRRIFFPAFHFPRISPKTVVLTATGAVVLFLLFMIVQVHIFLRFLITDLLTFPVTGILVGLFHIPTFVYHRLLIGRATQLLRHHKQMTVIGVTGSFGKTSTKEFLATILSRNYTVLKTEASKNSPIAIAETVLKHLTPDTQVFIVEMGAYKRGEIRAMADMVQPTIGIVTAINAQHQDLFGSLDATMAAKYELIQGLGGGKIGIFNADNAFTRHMGERAKREGYAVWWYTTLMEQERGMDTFEAHDIEVNEASITANITYKKQTLRLNAHVLGAHQVGNILAAIAGSVAAGMEFAEAVRAASRIQSFPKIMEPVKGTHGAIFINDTFNNNPDAAQAAIDFLAKTKGRKILVFQPMIELGAYAAESHRTVGREAARVCDDVLLTNENFYEHFLSGAREVSAEYKVRVVSSRPAASYIRETVKKGDTVLFKGKEAERVLTLCLNK